MKAYIQMTLGLATAFSMGSMVAQAQAADTADVHSEGNPAPTAYVYVSTSNGVNLYDAASNGHLTAVNSSPYHTAQPLIGSNGKYLLTLDNSDWSTVHSYSLASNGGIVGQVSTLDTQIFTGSDCGNEDRAQLDHTGENIYILLDTTANCAAYQTIGINPSSGALSFKGAAVNNNIQLNECCTATAEASNNKFAYSVEQGFYCDGCFDSWGQFKISSGKLENMSAGITGPEPKTSTLWLSPHYIATDNADHVIVLGQWYDNNAGQYTDDGGLAVYTVNPSTGALNSTNTWKQMPSPSVGGPTEIRPSPDGKYLAVAGFGGLRLYHLNGANVPTAIGGLITSTEIDHIRWDSNDHLYALSDAYDQFASPNGKAELLEYAVTSSSATAVSSPLHIAGANGLVVVVK